MGQRAAYLKAVVPDGCRSLLFLYMSDPRHGTHPQEINYSVPTGLHRGTVGALIDWLEWHTNALVPDNGMESWYVPRTTHGCDTHLARDDILPSAVHHVACYVADGANEGRYIYVTLALRDRGAVQVGSAKSFGGAGECWRIARLCSEALTAIFAFHEQQVFRDLFLRLPHAQSWRRETTLNGRATVCCAGDRGLEVRDGAGGILDHRTFAGANARIARAAYIADWTTVLAVQGVAVDVVESGAAQCHA